VTQELATEQQYEDNDEAIRAWDGPLFERFLQFRHLICDGLAAHGETALALCPPNAGERVLDIGCGFGETTTRLAGIVGPAGEAVGVDAAPRFIEVAEREAAGVPNARFAVVDVENANFDEAFDMAFSRMGTMFFANPVAALRRVGAALVPGGRLAIAVWRAKVENEWLMRAQETTERFVTKPEDYDEPTCGPGPFSMANADTTSAILKSAGFDEISLRRCDEPIKIGGDIDEAVEFVMSLGPAGEILRLAGERGVVAPASSWIVTARVPS
jgi:ubiquinone/menaquinone biosynthesis C-methylase UbiE